MPETRFHCVHCGTALKAAVGAHDDIIECPACSRVVPVPGKLKGLSQSSDCVGALPPDVLALEVKFLCRSCDNKLRADARWEGRNVKCPVCGSKIMVPRWSRSAGEEVATPSSTRLALATADVALSVAEIEFLTEPGPVRPRMAC